VDRYIYAGNNPLKYVDPAGLEKYLAILVEQPAPGQNIAYRGMPPVYGHTSVGLIDTDNRSFTIKGFHPAGTINPIFFMKRSAGIIKDDSDRKDRWNVMNFVTTHPAQHRVGRKVPFEQR
jgi:hypothetical protein